MHKSTHAHKCLYASAWVGSREGESPPLAAGCFPKEQKQQLQLFPCTAAAALTGAGTAAPSPPFWNQSIWLDQIIRSHGPHKHIGYGNPHVLFFLSDNY